MEPRGSRRRVPTGAGALAVVATCILMAGCGGSKPSGQTDGTKPVQRQASAEGFPDSKTCPEKSPSFRFDMWVVNLLPWAVKMKAGNYTCDDWSGVSTPGNAMNGRVVQPNDKLYFRLEPRQYRTRNWTMEFGDKGGFPYGQVDMSIPMTADPDPYTNFIKLLRPNVSGKETLTVPGLVTYIDCRFSYVNTINTREAPTTPDSDYLVPPNGNFLRPYVLALVSRKGKFTVAVCTYYG